MAQPGIALSKAEARRLALLAQGLSKRQFAEPLDVLRHLGAIQLDAIQRLDKAHRLVCKARIPDLAGRNDVDDRLWSADGEAAVYESWAHAVCLLPTEDWPLWAFARRRAAGASWAPPREVCDRVLNLVREQGPLTLRDLESGSAKSSGWDWSETKRAAEYLLWSGRLICAARQGTRRVYDLPERRLPARLLEAPVEDSEGRRALVRKAARACSVATAADLAEYFRMARAVVDAVLPDLDLVPATVEGWNEPAWADPTVLEQVFAPGDPVFLAPFDSLVWDRKRTRRLFDFDYVFEAYKPAAKREFGYYVTPLLAGDALIGRADLRRDPNGLHADRIWCEPGTNTGLDALHEAGHRLATQLGCPEFTVGTVIAP